MKVELGVVGVIVLFIAVATVFVFLVIVNTLLLSSYLPIKCGMNDFSLENENMTDTPLPLSL